MAEWKAVWEEEESLRRAARQAAAEEEPLPKEVRALKQPQFTSQERRLLRDPPYQAEVFVQTLMKGATQTYAYLKSHPDSTKEQAYEQAGHYAQSIIVAPLLNAARLARAQEIGIDTAWAVREFIDCYHQCRDNSDMKNALRALETIVKHVGGFNKDAPHMQVNTNGNIQINMIEVRHADGHLD